MVASAKRNGDEEWFGKPLPAEFQSSIYHGLAQSSSGSQWTYGDIIRDLHAWAERFNLRFKLRIPRHVVIGIWSLRRAYGTYQPGHNQFGLRAEILLDREYVHKSLRSDEIWKVYGTLLHEQLHCWQEFHGKPGKGNYHNLEFRNKARDLGLEIDQRGYTEYYPAPTPFTEMLREYKIVVPHLNHPSREFSTAERKYTSKIKPWVCGCNPPQRAQVAKENFDAVCPKCQQPFERVALPGF